MNKGKEIYKKIFAVVIVIAMVLSLMGCAAGGTNSAETESAGTESASALTPVDSYQVLSAEHYEDQGITESPVTEVSSGNGLCTITEYPSYYDVELDYENGTPEEVGKAYGETILEIYPDYASVIEPYIYENIRQAFSGENISYDAVEQRESTLLSSLSEEYRMEIEAMAEAVSGGQHGFAEDGILSYEEFIIAQMIPDALRPTACSAFTVWGDHTESGKRISMRILEWSLGSECQWGYVNAVVHMKKGENSIMLFSALGLLNVISGINDNGVFTGILDVGSIDDSPYIYEGKKCYTYDIRYALENFDTAVDVGNYMVENSGAYTYCHNLTITDADSTYCAEDLTAEEVQAGRGQSILRGENTPLMEGLNWDVADSFCIVNSYATAVNSSQDKFTGSEGNLVRFEKYRRLAEQMDHVTVGEFKDLITNEKTDQYVVAGIHSSSTLQIILIDYATGEVQVAFTGPEGVSDKPQFTAVGHY